MTEKRFRKGYCCGDTGLIDEQKGEWFIENINSVSDLKKNWDKVIDKLNEVAEENEQLKQELFESEYENICERYHDNSIRRDSWVEDLKEEFKERFGRDFE